ncbi:MAG: hypothetical protein IPQ13_07375 [Holophagaceae bacterium]|nr:hypothetical protein [Holophagaceae bacterium]
MHPLVERFLAKQLPDPMAMALLGGSLPVPPQDLLHAIAGAVFTESQYALRGHETLMGMPESLLATAISGELEDPDILGVILVHRKEPALLELALLHEALTAEWMEKAVPHLPGSVLEIPLNNQVMWLKRPRILDLIEEHPEGDYNIKRRVNENRFHVLGTASKEVFEERIEILDDVVAGKLDKAWAELPMPMEGAVEGAEEEEAEPADEEDVEAVRDRLLKPILDLDGNEIPLSLTQRVMRLKTNQKIMLAIKGGKEERTLLIRESNRLIQVNVIRNPRIGEGEVAYISQMRTVKEEVLRIISMNREWMKKYGIMRNLAFNPRTPLPIALNQLKRLIEFDLKMMQRDRNIPELLRREAKRLVENKGKG